MVHDRKQSFVLRSYYYTVHHSELREQIVSMRYLISQTEQNAHM